MSQSTSKRRPPQGHRHPPGRRPREVLSAVRPVAERLASERQLYLWDLSFRREAGRDTLSVSLDRPGGIESGEVSGFADALSRALDAEDAVPGEQRYLLEVSSPGAERRLKTPEHFQVCVGRRARLTFRGERPPAEGEIVSADEQAVTIDGDEGIERVPFDEISQARLSVPGV